MSKVIIEEDTLIGIADAIRTKKGTSDLIPTPNMKDEILSISGGGEVSHREVSSIIADGASYIKTDIYPTPNYSIEMEFKLTEVTADRYEFVFGTRYNTTGRWHARFNSESEGKLLAQRSPYFYADASSDWFNSVFTKQDWLDYKIFKMSKEEVYIDGELVHTYGNSSSSLMAGHYPCSVYLFAINSEDETGESPLENCGHIECKYVKIWDANDELILDLIPVVKTDGTVCMFDKVNSRYYYNAGTGSFSYSE